MSLSFRHVEILDLARQSGRVTVDGLAAHFNVTPQTIRRDLADLAEAGKLDRVHGGAVMRSGVSNIGYQDRRALNAAAKQAIARRCATLIPDGASVFLGIGTTTEAVAQELLHHDALLVVTNNMNVANILVANPNAEIIATGGSLRRSDGGLVGTLAMRSLQQFKPDIAVLGCSALDSDGDLLDFDMQEVGVNQTILAQTRHSILVADASKFQRTAPARIASLRDLDTLVTDQPLTAALTAKCRDWDTAVHIAP